MNIARSPEEAKEQTKSGKAIITTETTGGDIRSERAQKDAKRFDKKESLIKPQKEGSDLSENLDKTVEKEAKTEE